MSIAEDAICPTCGKPSTWYHPDSFAVSDTERAPWPKGAYLPAGPAYCDIPCRRIADAEPPMRDL